MRAVLLATCVAMLLTTALTVQAQEMGAGAPPPMGGQGGMGGRMRGMGGMGGGMGGGENMGARLSELKSKMAEMHQKHEAEKSQRRAQEDALDNKCYAALQAATSFDVLRSTHEQCRSEREALRGQFKEEHQEEMGARGGGMGGQGGRMGMQGGMAPGAMAAK